MNAKQFLTVFLAGVRDDSFKDRLSNETVDKFLADVYLPGTGAFSVPLTQIQYGQLLNVPPMSGQYKLPFRLEVSQQIKTSKLGNSYASAQLVVRFGVLEPLVEAPVVPVGKSAAQIAAERS